MIMLSFGGIEPRYSMETSPLSGMSGRRHEMSIRLLISMEASIVSTLVLFNPAECTVRNQTQ